MKEGSYSIDLVLHVENMPTSCVLSFLKHNSKFTEGSTPGCFKFQEKHWDICKKSKKSTASLRRLDISLMKELLGLGLGQL